MRIASNVAKLEIRKDMDFGFRVRLYTVMFIGNCGNWKNSTMDVIASVISGLLHFAMFEASSLLYSEIEMFRSLILSSSARLCSSRALVGYLGTGTSTLVLVASSVLMSCT